MISREPQLRKLIPRSLSFAHASTGTGRDFHHPGLCWVPIGDVECSENCWKLDSNRLNEILLSPDALNVLSLAAEYENLSVTTTTQVSAQGDSQQGSIHWDVSKQAGTEVSSIGMSISIQGTQLDTEEVVSGNMTNIRVGSAWFQGRDARPEYVDPFVYSHFKHLPIPGELPPGSIRPPFFGIRLDDYC